VELKRSQMGAIKTSFGLRWIEGDLADLEVLYGELAQFRQKENSGSGSGLRVVFSRARVEGNRWFLHDLGAD